MKKQRWYSIDKDRLFVYNAPTAEAATSVSVVSVKDLGYYQNNFKLAKLWETPNEDTSLMQETDCFMD